MASFLKFLEVKGNVHVIWITWIVESIVTICLRSCRYVVILEEHKQRLREEEERKEREKREKEERERREREEREKREREERF